ncbi:hypothetical protein [Beutenbergia cavernae]|nr:hypothetical protein [Beutenbergia cavernae]
MITEVSGVVTAPPDRVRDALVASLLPGGPHPEGTFVVEDTPGHRSTVELAADHLAIQGGWWYRGEWTVSTHPDGTLVEHRVRNVANRARWGVGLANGFFVGFAARTRESFAGTLADVAHELGATSQLT